MTNKTSEKVKDIYSKRDRGNLHEIDGMLSKYLMMEEALQLSQMALMISNPIRYEPEIRMANNALNYDPL